MRTNRSIHSSTWIVRHQRTKHIFHDLTVEGIIVTGNDLLAISENDIFVKRVYQSVFNKDKWKNEMTKGSLTVLKIKLGTYLGESQASDDDPIMGNGLVKEKENTKHIEPIFK